MELLLFRLRPNGPIVGFPFLADGRSDGGFWCAPCGQTHFIDAPRQRGCVMAVNIRAADNQRNLSAFLLEPDPRRLLEDARPYPSHFPRWTKCVRRMLRRKQPRR